MQCVTKTIQLVKYEPNKTCRIRKNKPDDPV